jgi:hypothetical protein
VGYLTLPNSLKDKDMSKTKSWIMNMEEHVWDAIEEGWSSLEDVQSYVADHMSPVDKDYVKSVYNELIESEHSPRLLL